MPGPSLILSKPRLAVDGGAIEQTKTNVRERSLLVIGRDGTLSEAFIKKTRQSTFDRPQISSATYRLMYRESSQS